MRTDLKLNYAQLEDIKERITNYYNALDAVETAVKDLKEFLGGAGDRSRRQKQ